jgi:hypothetical protein
MNSLNIDLLHNIFNMLPDDKLNIVACNRYLLQCVRDLMISKMNIWRMFHVYQNDKFFNKIIINSHKSMDRNDIDCSTTIVCAICHNVNSFVDEFDSVCKGCKRMVCSGCNNNGQELIYPKNYLNFCLTHQEIRCNKCCDKYCT